MTDAITNMSPEAAEKFFDEEPDPYVGTVEEVVDCPRCGGDGEVELLTSVEECPRCDDGDMYRISL